ncbi:rhodanese-like domain-containing protein [Mycetocola sp. 2940]|uniref:rhodanese-like domain-containing protein n=1 Tax=Mycetocola sp. 2940 TaxID=3156452 RepID=UPI00339700D7
MDTITVTELARLNDAAIIDVREPDEFEQVRAVGASSIPMSQFVERESELPADETLYVICASGARSARVVEYLEARDYRAVNVEGGTYAWRDAGLPVAEG